MYILRVTEYHVGNLAWLVEFKALLYDLISDNPNKSLITLNKLMLRVLFLFQSV